MKSAVTAVALLLLCLTMMMAGCVPHWYSAVAFLWTTSCGIVLLIAWRAIIHRVVGIFVLPCSRASVLLSRLVDDGEQCAIDQELELQRQQLNGRHKHLTLPTARGHHLDVWVVEPEASTAKKLTMIHFPANAAQCELDYNARCAPLAAVGVRSILFNYHSVGQSTGVCPTLQGLEADGAAVVAFALQFVPASQLVLMGHSLGGAVACHAAGHVPGVGVVLDRTFTSLAAVIAGMVVSNTRMQWVLESAWNVLSGWRIEVAAALDKVTGPVVVLQHTHDELLGPSSQLASALPKHGGSVHIPLMCMESSVGNHARGLNTRELLAAMRAVRGD